MRTDSTPLGKFQEEFTAMFWDRRRTPGPRWDGLSDISGNLQAQADDFSVLLFSPEYHAHPRG